MKTKVDFKSLIREDLVGLKPYFPIRYQKDVDSPVWLDANENAYNQKWGRYPNPNLSELKEKIAQFNPVKSNQILISHGSDEAIDLLIRTFCTPQKDAISIIIPGFEMYQHAARIAAVDVIKHHLPSPFIPDDQFADQILAQPAKLLILCSPNNPTGNLLPDQFIDRMLNEWPGILVIDEAYIHFAEKGASKIDLIEAHPNLIIMQTFSKALGLAGLRVGMTFAQSWVIDILNAVKMPYNVSQSSCEIALEALNQFDKIQDEINLIKAARSQMIARLSKIPFIKTIYPSDANFILIECQQAKEKYQALLEKGVFVRLRKELECADCLRLSVGTAHENELMLSALESLAHPEKSLV